MERVTYQNNLNLNIDGVVLQQQTTVKFVGMFIDHKLTWCDHIAHVNIKISKSLYALNCIKRYVPMPLLKTLYYTMVQTYLSYGIIFWGSANQGQLQKTVKLQKKAIRIVNGATYNAHTLPLFRDNNILILTDMYKTEVLKFMYDIIAKLSPIKLIEMFMTNIDVHGYNTRQNFHIRDRRTLKASKSLLHAGPQLWSNLPNEIRRLTEKNLFKSKIKSHCIIQYNP